MTMDMQMLMLMYGVTDRLTLIAQWFTRMFPALATIG